MRGYTATSHKRHHRRRIFAADRRTLKRGIPRSWDLTTVPFAKVMTRLREQ